MTDLIHDYRPEALLEMSKPEAEKALNRLELPDQLAMVLMAPWEKRQEILLLSHRTRELVRIMPPEELFWTIKAVGPEDALHILSLTAPHQLQFMLDLDTWEKDVLKPEKIMAWLLLMFEAGEDLVTTWIKWIHKKDEWLIPALLIPFITVFKRPDDMDTQEARDTLPAFTLDDVYYVAFKKERFTPLFSRLLFKLAEASPGIYRDSLESLLWKTPSHITETAYRLRKARLSDHGLPDYYDSLDIYAPLPGNQVRKVSALPSGWSTEALDLSFVPTIYMGEYPTLVRAVQSLSGTASLARVLQEWIGAANKVLMADLVDLDEPAAMQNALLKVAALLNLALEVESAETGDRPEDILAVSVLEDLIRLSNSMTRDLSSRVKRMQVSGLLPHEFVYLPEDWAETLKGLTGRDPMIFDAAGRGFRWMSTREDASGCNGFLERIEDWARLMGALEPHWSTWDGAFPWQDTNLSHPVELLWPRALLTALARDELGHGLAVAPIEQGELGKLRRAWFSREGKPRDAGRIITSLAPLAERAGVQRGFLTREIPPLVEGLGAEIQDIPWEEEIDGRFVTWLLVLLRKTG